MSATRLHRIAPALVALALLASPRSLAAQIVTGGCNFGKGSPIGEQSSWAEQFRCYQQSGRHVSVIGTVFEAGTGRGDQCVRAVAPDRVQIAACGGFGSDAALTLAYAQIAYVFDDPRRDAVEITLAPILRH